jgi:hypothetical protein
VQRELFIRLIKWAPAVSAKNSQLALDAADCWAGLLVKMLGFSKLNLWQPTNLGRDWQESPDLLIVDDIVRVKYPVTSS